MNVERLDSRPVRWYTVLGLVLVPILVAGGFLLAGVNSSHRLHTVQAAVVNLDEAVTIDGQYTPLGRQLTANLVDSDRIENLTWVLQSEENARAGLNTGEYAAMVVIPKNFSAAATSFSKDADEVQQATIQVYTSPVAGVADATLGRLVASEAASMLNSTLTEGYLKQIYVGFNDMGKQFVTMADGADQLADGTEKLADGISSASDGTQQLYRGQRKLADGLGQMKDKTAGMPKDIRKLANGVGDYVDGVNQLVDSSVSGQQTMIATVKQFEDGAGGMVSGLKDYQSSMADLGNSTQAVSAAKAAAATRIPCPTMSADEATQKQLCAVFEAGRDGAAVIGVGVGGQAAAAGLEQEVGGRSVLGGAQQLAGGLTQFRQGLEAAANDKDTAKQLAQLKAGGKQLAKGTDQLADQMPQLVDGIAQSADGAGQLADGIDQLGAGLITASSGGQKLADGMRKMSDGIAEGKDKLPSYSKTDRENLSTVVASPIDTSSLNGLANANVGWISLVLVLSLWLGALATYSVVKAIGAGLLSSSEPTALLIARSLVPGLVVVGVQAVLVAALSRFGLDLSWQKWLAVTGVLLLAGAAFVVINHALVAWLGGVGRLVSVLFAVLTTASALIGAAPAVFAALRPFSPLTPALDAIRAIVTESSGAPIATLTLAGWLLIALVASAVAVARRRTTTLAAVLAAS